MEVVDEEFQVSPIRVREFIWVTDQMKMDRKPDFAVYTRPLEWEDNFPAILGNIRCRMVDIGAKWIRQVNDGSGWLIEGWR